LGHVSITVEEIAALEGLERNDSIATVNHLQTLIERDKTALAREIHDDLGGYLIASAMDITVLKERFAAHDTDSLNRFERVTQSLNAAVDMMRRVTEELRPTLLDNVGLFAALRWQIKHMVHRSKIRCTEQLPAIEPRLTPAAAIVLFRAGQESLVVAENQPAVTGVNFAIAIDRECLSMCTMADGTATAPSEDSRGYIALGFLRHRIRAIGGTVTMTHPDDKGIHLVVRVGLATVLATSDAE